MMHGIRLAVRIPLTSIIVQVAEVTASQSRSSRDVERKDYDLTVEFEMKRWVIILLTDRPVSANPLIPGCFEITLL